MTNTEIKKALAGYFRCKEEDLEDYDFEAPIGGPEIDFYKFHDALVEVFFGDGKCSPKDIKNMAR